MVILRHAVRAATAAGVRAARARAPGGREDYPSGVMDTPMTPPAGGPGPRRRDRHGRGMRGPIAPPQVPLAASRADLFADLVQDSVERLERRWPQLADVDFHVLEVPQAGGTFPVWNDEAVPLGGVMPARDGQRARVVVYRRPVEIRSKGRDERAALVHEVVVEQIAELLGLTPETVDPRYGED
ncbi:metallopeptidase family protein [Streptomyces sp. RG38]|uniref:Metallopeptidase family protein n=2 Tax=Streptomyces tagetis TaxID=2820809 RepID=A0A941B2V4_9ACTN|nr:metallopeptidase family protein [Streptomyces sp. RG38]